MQENKNENNGKENNAENNAEKLNTFIRNNFRS